MHEAFLEVKTPLNVLVRTTKEYWNYLIEVKHPYMKDKQNEVVKTLSEPDMIRVSKIDNEVFLYYKKIENYL